MTGGREPLSRPSSRHGEARHPLTLNLLMLRVARAASDCQGKRPHPDGRRWSLPCPCRRKGGACRLSEPALHTWPPEPECVRGLLVERRARRSAPVRRAGPSASPAPLRFPGVLRGAPRRWGRRKRHGGSGSGEDLPLSAAIGAVGQSSADESGANCISPMLQGHKIKYSNSLVIELTQPETKRE